MNFALNYLLFKLYEKDPGFFLDIVVIMIIVNSYKILQIAHLL